MAKSVDGPAELEIDGRAQGPHRASMARKQATDPRNNSTIVIVVVAEVEKRIAVVAVDSEVAAHAQFEAAAGVPSEFGGADFQVVGWPLERFDASLVPSGPTEQVRLDGAAR